MILLGFKLVILLSSRLNWDKIIINQSSVYTG